MVRCDEGFTLGSVYYEVVNVVDILGIEFDARGERCSAESYKTGFSDFLNEFSKVLGFFGYNHFLRDFLFLVRLDHDQCVVSACSGSRLLDTFDGTGNAGMDRGTYESFRIADLLADLDVIAFGYQTPMCWDIEILTMSGIGITSVAQPAVFL